MSITINEALELEIFASFKTIAGNAGLSNKIKRVGIWDHETGALIEENFVEGEFVVTTLFVIKDKIEELYEIVKKMIAVGVSGLAFKNVYFNDLPEVVLELANRNSFPIMIYSKVYFEDVIASVLYAIKEKEEKEDVAIKIDTFLYRNLDNVSVRNIAYEINRDFKENNIVTYCKRKQKEDFIAKGMYLNIEKESTLNKVIPYREGCIIIHTFEKISSNEIVDMTGTDGIGEVILRRLENWGFTSDKFVIGMSSLYENLSQLNDSVKESVFAFKYATMYKKSISCFNKIGTSKIFLPLLENPWVLKYHDEMIVPLLEYDNKKDTELLKTAIHYVENNGDIKSTATELFQHNNTIRYRIDKIYKILSRNCNSENFYEELAAAIRIHNLLNKNL